jgi:hypothetical protein
MILTDEEIESCSSYSHNSYKFAREIESKILKKFIIDGYFYKNPNNVSIECDPKHKDEDGVFPLYTIIL